MPYLKPPIELANPENQESYEFFRLLDMTDINYDYTPEFYQHAKCLWNDEGVQECYRRSNEFTLIDSAK